MLKILVIGQSNVGKTSIVNRFIQNKFESTYKATIACEFQTKLLNLGESEFRIQLWDLVGQDQRIGALNKLFCRGAMGAICVADITSQESLESAVSWKDQIDACVQLKDGSQIPVILFVNKYDMVQDLEEEDLSEHMKQQYLDEFANQNDFISAERVSAKTAHNVNDAFGKIVREVLMRVYIKEGGAKGANPKESELLKSVVGYQED